jgi:predicted metalloendopeptidase
MSAGEDLADISAITICEQYLRDFQIKNEYIIPIRNLSFTNFFTYFAHQMRQSIAKKAYRVQMVTNPHPLDKYRVNVPLSRLKLFRSIYNIKKGDKMYWKNIESIW